MTDTRKNTVTEINEKSILDTANGAINERIAFELPKILANIVDPNTDAKKIRTMAITIKFLPTEDRQFCALSCVVSSKLQPTDPIPATLMLRDIGNNHVQAIEIGKQIPGQIDLDGDEEPQAAIIKQIK